MNFDFLSPIIGLAQLGTLLGIFLRLGRMGATLEQHEERLKHLEETPHHAKLA